MFYSCRSPIQNCNASFRLPQWTVTTQSLASWQFSIDVEYLNKSRLQLCYLTGAELSAAGWTAVSLFFRLAQSFEPLEVFDLEAVDLSWWIQSADSGGCDCYIWTQLQSYGFFLFEPTQHIFQSPWYPYFYVHPWCPLWEESDPLHVSPVLLCLLSHREWTLAGWQLAPPLSPVISSRLLYCVSLPPWQSSVDIDRLFWTEIPASLCQTKQTLP